MARSWSIVDTITPSPGNRNIATNLLKTLVYYISANKHAIYSWDGTTETDISGSTFDSPVQLVDLCLFNGTLYAAANDDVVTPTYRATIYQYSGTGQSWNDVFEMCTDCGEESPTYYHFGAGEDRKVLTADATRIIAVAPPYLIFASTDGSSWTAQTIESDATKVPYLPCLGLYGTELDEIILMAYDVTPYWNRLISHSSGSNWTALSASNVGTIGQINSTLGLCGYADSLSFWIEFGASSRYWFKYSSDWGVNRTLTTLDPGATSASLKDRIVYVASNAIMTAKGATAYVWNGTDDFVADGTTGSDNILTFFELNGTIYAFADNARIYSGGAVGTQYALTHSADAIPGGILV